MPNLAQKQPCVANLALISPLLNEIELEACRLRFEGYTTLEAETMLTRYYGDHGPKAKTMRNWFAAGGRLHSFYKSYADEKARERQTMAEQIFSAHVKNAARTIVRLMLDPNVSEWVQLRAAKYIIERELGPAPKTPVQPERKNPAREILKRLGIIDKDHINHE